MKAQFIGCYFLFAVIAFPIRGQVAISSVDDLASAARLNEQGRFPEALQFTERLVASSANPPDVVTGVAWNIRGLALENLGDWDGARRSYETSIEILRTANAPIKQYASALNNLGSLKADLGDFEESRSLRLHAIKLYRSINDHAGVARTFVNLALLSLAQKDRKHARRLLADAEREEAQVAISNSSEVASLYNVEAVEDAREGHLKEALDAIDRSIKLWTEGYGSNYYLIATGLCLRGQIHAASRNWDEAQADLVRSLDILKVNRAFNTKAYFVAEKAYASVLRARGNAGEAEELALDASRGLEGLRNKQCRGCSVSVESFR